MAKSALRLVRGGKSQLYRIGNIICTLTEPSAIADDLDAVVLEEDTHLILTVDGRCNYIETHPVRMMTEIHRAKVHEPGSLIVNGKSWYAVTIDLDSDPLCRPVWVQQVYENIALQIKKNSISKLGIFLLGNVHGGLGAAECVELFIKAVQTWHKSQLQEVCLIVPEKSISVVKEKFREEFEKSP